MISSSPKHDRVSYCVSGENLINTTFTQKFRPWTLRVWHTADNVLEGWQAHLERLFHKKEFAFGLRYVVYYGNPDKYTKQAYYRFAEAPDKILRHFSEGRLCSLVRTIQR